MFFVVCFRFNPNLGGGGHWAPLCSRADEWHMNERSLRRHEPWSGVEEKATRPAERLLLRVVIRHSSSVEMACACTRGVKSAVCIRTHVHVGRRPLQLPFGLIPIGLIPSHRHVVRGVQQTESYECAAFTCNLRNQICSEPYQQIIHLTTRGA